MRRTEKHRDTDDQQNRLDWFNDGKYEYLGLVNTKDVEGKEVWAGVNSAGFAIMNSNAPDLAHGDTVVEVPMLVVSEDRRREGIGQLLMEDVRNVAAENSATVIELVATSANVQARDFYRSLGFVEADVVSMEFVGDPQDPPDGE